MTAAELKRGTYSRWSQRQDIRHGSLDAPRRTDPQSGSPRATQLLSVAVVEQNPGRAGCEQDPDRSLGRFTSPTLFAPASLPDGRECARRQSRLGLLMNGLCGYGAMLGEVCFRDGQPVREFAEACRQTRKCCAEVLYLPHREAESVRKAGMGRGGGQHRPFTKQALVASHPHAMESSVWFEAFPQSCMYLCTFASLRLNRLGSLRQMLVLERLEHRAEVFIRSEQRRQALDRS